MTDESVTVVSYANYRDQLLNEFEQSLINNKLKYKIVGAGEKWLGFINKTNGYYKELVSGSYSNSDLIILCDSFDILFLQNEKSILAAYRNIVGTGPDKLVIGAECGCAYLPPMISCALEQLECGLDTVNMNPELKKLDYINSGFIMGPVWLLKEAYAYIKGLNVDDDQYAWGLYRANHCDSVVLDYTSELVLNYKDNQKIEWSEDLKTVYNISNDNYPCAIHFYSQSLNPNGRSEKFRNLIFPGRSGVSQIEYLQKTSEKFTGMPFEASLSLFIATVLLIIGLVVFLIMRFKKTAL